MGGVSFNEKGFRKPDSNLRVPKQCPLGDLKQKKTGVRPGYSPLDWARLCASGQDLAGVGGKFLKVSLEELAEHDTEDDCWIAFKGKVYNLTPYLPYHPGGTSILEYVYGKDATELFNRYHAWVAGDRIMEPLLVGYLEN